MKRFLIISLMLVSFTGLAQPAASEPWKEIKNLNEIEQVMFIAGLFEAYVLFEDTYELEADDKFCIPSRVTLE